jgi:hypothetical protein
MLQKSEIFITGRTNGPYLLIAFYLLEAYCAGT